MCNFNHRVFWVGLNTIIKPKRVYKYAYMSQIFYVYPTQYMLPALQSIARPSTASRLDKTTSLPVPSLLILEILPLSLSSQYKYEFPVQAKLESYYTRHIASKLLTFINVNISCKADEWDGNKKIVLVITFMSNTANPRRICIKQYRIHA